MSEVVVRDSRFQLSGEIRTFRAGSDEAHLPQKHVPQLRQLVDPCGAQEAPHARNTRIAFSRPSRAGLFSVLDHGTELVKTEGCAIEPGARLAIENGTLAVELDGDSCDQHQWRQ